MNKNEARKSRATVPFKVHLHEIFFLVFCTDQTYICKIIRLLSGLDFVFEFVDLFKFLMLCGDSIDANLSPSQLSQCHARLYIYILSQRGVRLHVN
jgi:hypothetical protein